MGLAKNHKEINITSNNDFNKHKRRNFLVIVCFVKKFIQIIKSFTYLKKIFSLKLFHFNIINDNSCFYQKGSEFGQTFFMNLKNANSHNYVYFIGPIFL